MISLFKYRTYEGAIKILTTGSIYFPCPDKLNDPFEVPVDEIGPFDLFESRFELYKALKEVLLRDNFPILDESINNRKMRVLHRQIKEDPETIQKFLSAPTLDVWSKESVLDSSKQLLQQLREKIRSVGIFSACTNATNTALWSHYGDNHQGVVIELLPNIAKDSFLRLAWPFSLS